MHNSHASIITRIGFAMAVCVISHPAAAQLVEIGPGYVRAPFVEVFSHPNGSSFVRAPFVSVHSPPRFPFFAPPASILPGPLEFNSVNRLDTVDALPNLENFNWRALREIARRGVANLDNELSRRNAAADWREYLRIDELRDLFVDDVDGPPAEAERAMMTQILERYDATLRSPDLQHVTYSAGFQTVQRVLTEIVQRPFTGQRQSLWAAGLQLRRELEQRGAVGWIDYLGLNQFTDRSARNPLPPPPDAPRDAEDEYGRMLERFELVDQDSRYQAIARLPAFQNVVQRLRELQGAERPPAEADAEQLPAPLLIAPDLDETR